MDNYAKGYGCLQGHLECLINTLEVKIMHDYHGEVTIPKEVTEELKAQISHMLKRSEEVGNEPSEFMNIPKKEEEDDRGWYLEYDASDPTCNLPVPDEVEHDMRLDRKDQAALERRERILKYEKEQQEHTQKLFQL